MTHLYPIYEHALESLRDLISHNCDLNFGHELPIQVSDYIQIPDHSRPGSTLQKYTVLEIINSVYESHFDDSRDSNIITTFHKSVIKLQQDINVYLLEVDEFIRRLQSFPLKQYLPSTITRVIQCESLDLDSICRESFASFLMGKLISTIEIDMMRKLGHKRILQRFCLTGKQIDRDAMLLERQNLNNLLNKPERSINYYRLANYFVCI